MSRWARILRRLKRLFGIVPNPESAEQRFQLLLSDIEDHFTRCLQKNLFDIDEVTAKTAINSYKKAAEEYLLNVPGIKIISITEDKDRPSTILIDIEITPIYPTYKEDT